MSDHAPIRVLIIGSSFGGKVTAPGFASDPAFRVVGMASGHAESAKRVAAEQGIPYATDDWKKMLEEVEADLVAIATPVDLHYPMARAALERKRHVLCEKPFALNVAQAKELDSLARSQGVVNVVNHEFRHQPARATLTRWIEEGKLGRLEHVTMSTRFPGWARDPSRRLTWLTEKDRGGGMLGALGSHDIDSLILWGGPIRRVFCRLRHLASTAPGVTPAHQAITAEDCYSLLLEYRSGATAVIDAFGGAHVRQERIEAFGSDGSLAVLDGERIGRPTASGGLDKIEIPKELRLEPTPAAPLIAPFRVKVAMIRDAIRDGKGASPTFADGVEVQRVLDSARLSDRMGQWVEIEE